MDDRGGWRWRALESRGDALERVARHGHTSTVLASRIYVFGGRTQDKSFLEGVHVLDPHSLIWKAPRVKRSPPLRAFHTADALENSRLVVFGGFGPSSADPAESAFFNDTWLFVVDRTVWESCLVAGEPPPPRAAHASVLLTGSRAGKAASLIIHGGTNNEKSFGDLWQLSIGSATWEKVTTGGAKLPSPRAYHTASLVGMTIVVFGGRTTKTICKSDAYLLDLTSREWTEVSRTAANAPLLGRSSHSAVVVGDEHVLIFGGKQEPERSATADDDRRYAHATASLLLFDGRSGRWAPPPPADAVVSSRGGDGALLSSLARSAHTAVVACVPPSMLVLGGYARDCVQSDGGRHLDSRYQTLKKKAPALGPRT